MVSKQIEIKTLRDSDPRNGSLSYLEANRDIPFEIKRVFYIHGSDKEIVRGGHAHMKVEQFLFCPYGRIEITLDDGINKPETVLLDNPSIGVYLPKFTFVGMRWIETGSILCVVASDYYDVSEYIREYEMFKNIIREQKSNGFLGDASGVQKE